MSECGWGSHAQDNPCKPAITPYAAREDPGALGVFSVEPPVQTFPRGNKSHRSPRGLTADCLCPFAETLGAGGFKSLEIFPLCQIPYQLSGSGDVASF